MRERETVRCVCVCWTRRRGTEAFFPGYIGLVFSLFLSKALLYFGHLGPQSLPRRMNTCVCVYMRERERERERQ